MNADRHPITESVISGADVAAYAEFFLGRVAGAVLVQFQVRARSLLPQCPVSGATWSLHALSNGTFFLSPECLGPMCVVDAAGCPVGELSAHAAGLAVSLHVLFDLWSTTKRESARALWERACLYARQHPEAAMIERAASL